VVRPSRFGTIFQENTMADMVIVEIVFHRGSRTRYEAFAAGWLMKRITSQSV
jgi:hypothetical protein